MGPGFLQSAFSSVWPWVALSLIPPAILALYFLKLKRQPLVVPSTYLWRKSIEDLHVNSLWQRLRKSILLFLQLLLVLLAILSLLQPGWEATELAGQRFIIMVDQSASMSATDVDDRENRLAAAKEQALAMIDQLPPGAEAMVMTFAAAPQIRQEFTTNHDLLEKAVNSIAATAQPTQLEDALEIVDALANPPQVQSEIDAREFDAVEVPDTTAMIFSDGRLPEVEKFTLGKLFPRFIPIGTPEASNIGITAFNTRQNDIVAGERQAFAEIANYSGSDAAVTANLYLDGAHIDAKQLTIEAGRAGGVDFSLANIESGQLRLEIESDDVEDQLSLDNQAFAAVNDARRGRVLIVTDGNEALQTVMHTKRAERVADVSFQSPKFLASEQFKKAAAAEVYDLIIFDRCRSLSMPRANTLFLGTVPPLAEWGDARPSNNENQSQESSSDATPSEPDLPTVTPAIIDWDRTHPLMAFVDLSDVLVAESLVLPVPLGGVSLIDARSGSVAAVSPREHFQDAVLGFSLFGVNEAGNRVFNTDWPYRSSFPTFWFNALDYLAGQAERLGVRSIQPGETIEFTLQEVLPKAMVVTPRGERLSVARDRSGFYQFQQTDDVGVYEVRDSQNVLFRFAVNLFDRQESDIALRLRDEEGVTVDGTSVASLKIGFEEIEAEQAFKPVRRELWRWLLLAALVVLMLEWYIYNRRAYL